MYTHTIYVCTCTHIHISTGICIYTYSAHVQHTYINGMYTCTQYISTHVHICTGILYRTRDYTHTVHTQYIHTYIHTHEHTKYKHTYTVYVYAHTHLSWYGFDGQNVHPLTQKAFNPRAMPLLQTLCTYTCVYYTYICK